jgi:DNA-binding transcriptional regulator WhiA
MRVAPSAGKPSFAADVKQELGLVVASRECCQVSELQGILDASDARRSPALVRCRLTRNTTARKVVRLAHLLAPGSDDRAHYDRGTTHIRPSYVVSIPLPEGTPLRSLAAPPGSIDRDCCARSYLRGAFLAAGIVSESSAGYHFELALRDARAAASVSAAMTRLELMPATRRRRAAHVVYVKSSQDISLLLAAMGASQAVLRLENARILREMRGQANRQANSETANLRRSVASSLRQLAAARRLAQAGALETQPQAIREIATLRLARRDASLVQLAEALGVSKSAVNARLRRLMEIAEALDGGS